MLQGVSLGVEGNPNDFTAGTPETDLLPPGGSTTLPVTFAASGPGERTAMLRIASTDTFNPPFFMHLSGTLPQGPDAWRLTHFGTIFNEGPAADLSDPDGDGSPQSAGVCLPDKSQRARRFTPAELVKNGDNLEYTFNRPSDATEFLTYSVESSIAPNEGWGLEEITQVILSGDGTRLQLGYPSPSLTPRGFLSGCA